MNNEETEMYDIKMEVLVMPDEMQIVDKLIGEIASGRYAADGQLPSENVLAIQYQVPRITVRKAYERLAELGYIYKKQGKGSYVKDRHKQIELVLSGDVSFSRKMTEKGYHFESKNVFCEEIRYNKKIYDFLETGQTDQVFKVGRLRFIDDQPTALHISYVAKSLFDDIDVRGKEIKSMFQYYNNKGYQEFSSKPSLLSISLPTKFQRELLSCPHLIPLLVLESGCIDKKSGRVLDYTKILYRSDCFSYVIPNQSGPK